MPGIAVFIEFPLFRNRRICGSEGNFSFSGFQRFSFLNYWLLRRSFSPPALLRRLKNAKDAKSSLFCGWRASAPSASSWKIPAGERFSTGKAQEKAEVAEAIPSVQDGLRKSQRRRPRTRLNSLTFPVARVRPSKRQCPAINVSYGPMPFPVRSNSRRTCALSRAASWPKAITGMARRNESVSSRVRLERQASAPTNNSYAVTLEIAESASSGNERKRPLINSTEQSVSRRNALTTPGHQAWGRYGPL